MNIHIAPAHDILARIGFEFTPRYLMFLGEENEVFAQMLAEGQCHYSACRIIISEFVYSDI